MTRKAPPRQTPPAFRPLLEKARYKGAYGGRGSGKSHFFAEHLIEQAYMDPTLRAVCVREVQRSLDQSVKKLIEDKIETLGVSAGFEVRASEIRLLDDEGRARGRIVFQDDLDEAIAIEGEPPPQLEQIMQAARDRAEAHDEGGADDDFDVPIDLAKSICGLRIDDLSVDEITFTQLEGEFVETPARGGGFLGWLARLLGARA